MSTTKKKKPTQKILYNNKYEPALFTKLAPLTNNTKTELNKIEWARFTYVGKETIHY